MVKREQAFTLIELLVVIAIIALLMAVIIPALSAAKRQAQTIVCSANIRSYGAALQAYAMENKDKAPYKSTWLFSANTIANPGAPFVKSCMWHNGIDDPDGSLWPYMDNEKSHMCPVFERFANQLGRDGVPCAGNHSLLTTFDPLYSYAMNWFVGFDWATLLKIGDTAMEQQEISMKLSRVTRASQCFAFSEENLWPIREEDWDGVNKYSENVLNDNALWVNANPDKPTGATDNVATYHNVNANKKNKGKANIVFVDGHVETRQGVGGRQAYLDYGKPYPGHENMNVW